MATLVLGNTWDFNTASTDAMGPDGFSWAQANTLIIDQWGKWITLAEDDGGQHYFVVSNDEGSTWTDTLSVSFVTRGDMDLDEDNDILYVLWEAAAATDGIIVRRYAIARDGSHNITSLSQMAGFSVQLDYQGADGDAATAGTFIHPRIIHMNDAGFGAFGAVLCTWSAMKVSLNDCWLRTTMRVLSGDANDANKTLWAAPVPSSTSTLDGLPHTVVYTSLTTPFHLLGFAVERVRTGTYVRDVAFVYTALNAGVVKIWRYKRMRWNAGTLDWSTGFTADVTVTAIVRGGTDTGYVAHRHELPTKLCVSAANMLYVGLPTWKTTAEGDTWSAYSINMDTNVVVRADVYSAGGPHSYAPAGDIVWDETSQRVVVSYIKTGTQFAYLQTYTPSLVPDQAETLMYSAHPVDIPLLYDQVTPNVLLSFFRDTDVPYVGHLVLFDWEASVSGGDEVTAGGVGRARLVVTRRRFIPREWPWMTDSQKQALREQNALLRR